MTTPSSIKSLLSALGLSVSKPAPPIFTFSQNNPMGTHIEEAEIEESITTIEGEWHSLSPHCSTLVTQAIQLTSLDECVLASDRVLTAIQTQTSRRIVLKLLSSSISKGLPPVKAISLDSVQHLIRLLRLVQANRVGIQSDSRRLQECVELAITAVASQGGQSGSQLLQVTVSSCL